MAELKSSEDIIGKQVANDEGHVIGTVNEIFFDTSWRVSDIRIKVDKAAAKQLDLKTPLLGSLQILVETTKVKAFTDQVILGIPSAQFKSYVVARQEEEKAAEKAAKEAAKAAAKEEKEKG